MSVQLFFQHLANGLSLGSLYALIAIGYTMVYGILRLINFAHGEIFMIGAYMAFYLVTLCMLPWFAAVVVALLPMHPRTLAEASQPPGIVHAVWVIAKK